MTIPSVVPSTVQIGEKMVRMSMPRSPAARFDGLVAKTGS